MSSDVLVSRAREAAQAANWFLLSQCLRRISASIGAPIRDENAESADSGHLNNDDSYRQSPSSSTSEAIDLALYALQSADFQTRWEIAKLIPSFGMAIVAPLLDLIDAALNDDDWELLWFTARILGEFRHSDAVAALCQLVARNHSPELTSVASQALAHIGELAIPALSQLLMHEESRLPAVQALGQINHRAALERLLSVADDADAEVRAVAIASISHARSPQVLPLLVDALDDEAAQVRQAAVESIGIWCAEMKESEFLRLTQPLLWDINLNVRRQTVQTLGRLRSAAVADCLNQALISPHTPESLKPDIVRALIWTETKAALHYLHEYTQQCFTLRQEDNNSLLATEFTSSSLYREIAVALGQVSQETLKPLAARILVDMAEDATILNNASLKQSLAFSLGQLNSPVAIAPLAQFINDEDSRVRLHAAAALKALKARGDWA